MEKNKIIIRATTVVCVRDDKSVVIASDGQVTLGTSIIKSNANKIRTFNDQKIIVGFAGSTADAFTLFERLEKKCEEFSYNLKSFPNPTSGSFISEISLQQSQNIEYFISNRDGKVVYRKNIFMQNGINKVPFNKNLPLGLYFISMKLENGKVFSDKILFKN